MPRSLSGQPLELDDGPARGRDVLVVDGNNLAHRSFHALPEAIATSWGLQSNALLGFANVFAKLLIDYRPRAAIVAWDRKPTERLAAAADYKAGRKPMATGLATQFPHFKTIVEAFGYPSIAVDGWEADDVIATLVTRAEAADLSSLVVSTDRDAFQLVTEKTALMMTPRGAMAPEVYTPDRVFARYGIGPGLIPDFIALKGDDSDNIPAVPGFGEKTAAALLAEHGSLENLIAKTSTLPPARRKALEANVEAARASRKLATLRRDLDFVCDVKALAETRPDRAKMVEVFTHFEFKRLLERRHLLDEAVPAAP